MKNFVFYSLRAALCFFSLFIFVGTAFAQSTTIKLTPADHMVIDEETSVVLELTDDKGQPLTKTVPQVVFSPSKFVENLEVYDCSDSSEFDNCQVNNRGVDGIFEALFTMVDAPVTMTVTAKGKSQSLKLTASEKKETVAVSSAPKPADSVSPLSSAPASPTSSSKSVSVSLDQIQVGPSPSVWMILFPLALILVVVTMFVVKTTD